MSPPVFDPLTGPLDGRNLVEASAGTGKTYTIAALFVRLVVEVGLGVDEILVVTFTEAATAELRGRIRGRLREAEAAFTLGPGADPFLRGLVDRCPVSEGEAAGRLRAAVRGFDRAEIHTIHGFCLRALQEAAFESGAPFQAKLVTDHEALVGEVVADFWRSRVYDAPGPFARYLRGQKVTVEGLTAFALSHARPRGLVVVPDGPAPDTTAVEGRVWDAFGAVRHLWAVHRDEVSRVLLASPDLNRTRYGLSRVREDLAELDRYLAGGDPAASPEGLVRLTPAVLEAGTRKGRAPPSHPVFDACGQLHQALEHLRAAYADRLRALRAELLGFVRREVAARRAARDVRSFDDLLTDLLAALEGPGGARLAAALRARHRAALVDEFQDTDPVQYGIFRRVFGEADEPRLFLIGDPKQAIYGFRGADLFAYLGAARDADRRFTLDRNWRSSQALLDGVEAVFGASPTPFVLGEIGFAAVSAGRAGGKTPLVEDGAPDPYPLRIWWEGRPGEKPLAKGRATQVLVAAVAQEVVSLLHDGRAGRLQVGERPLGPEDVAVLVRTNAQARRVAAALNRRGVPAVVHSAESLFDAREARELYRILAAVAEPSDEGLVRSALATEILGVTGRALHEIAGDPALWDRWADAFDRYRRRWEERGFAAAIYSLLSEQGVRARLVAYRDGERRVTNVLHCVEVLQRAAVENKLGPEGLVAWLGRQLEERPDGEEYQLRLETDAEAVQVLTVHRSKGLEYPVVLCPFAWEGLRDRKKDEREPARFHDPAEPGRVVLDLGSDRFRESVSLARRETLAEWVRLLYVALTRARQRCYVAWGRYGSAPASPLAYLLHAPEAVREAEPAELVETLERAFAAQDSPALERAVGGVVVRSGGRVLVSSPPEQDSRTWSPDGVSRPALAEPPAAPGIPRGWGLMSFSGFVSGRPERAERPDRDEGTGGGPEAGAPPARTVFGFPRGSRAGQCVHAVFEALDYVAPTRDAVTALAEAQLVAHGFDRGWAGVVADLVDRVLDAPVLGPGVPFRLRGLEPADRVAELEFLLAGGRVTPAGLARTLSDLRDPAVPADLSDRVARLGFPAVRGLLKGFVDLVFRYGGRYYLLDWKSNHLGDHPGAYDRPAMAAEMARHHYDLQYLLYAAALHRYLGRRLPGYRYDDHFGGAVYVFVRGVSPGTEHGLFRARPAKAVVDGLARYLARGDDDG